MSSRKDGKQRKRKYCKESHKSGIKFKCSLDEVYTCDDCAIEHSDHFKCLTSLKSIFEAKLPRYRDFKEKLRILGRVAVDREEIERYIYELLERRYKELMEDMEKYKEEWMKSTFEQCMESIEIEHLRAGNLQQMRDLDKEICSTIDLIQNYVNFDSEQNLPTPRGTSGVLKVREPWEFERKFNKLISISDSRRELGMVRICKELDKQGVRNMFRITGPIHNPSLSYKGTLLSKEGDFNFLITSLPLKVRELNLLYKGTKDGFSTRTFHELCDGVPHTLTVIKAQGLHGVFGGYTPLPWNSTGGAKNDPSRSSFLFTCSHASSSIHCIHPLLSVNGENAIYNSGAYGPTFGGRHDLTTCGFPGTYSMLGGTYQLPQGGGDYLGGGGDYKLLDYEVLQVII